MDEEGGVPDRASKQAIPDLNSSSVIYIELAIGDWPVPLTRV